MTYVSFSSLDLMARYPVPGCLRESGGRRGKREGPDWTALTCETNQPQDGDLVSRVEEASAAVDDPVHSRNLRLLRLQVRSS